MVSLRSVAGGAFASLAGSDADLHFQEYAWVLCVRDGQPFERVPPHAVMRPLELRWIGGQVQQELLANDHRADLARLELAGVLVGEADEVHRRVDRHAHLALDETHGKPFADLM